MALSDWYLIVGIVWGYQIRRNGHEVILILHLRLSHQGFRLSTNRLPTRKVSGMVPKCNTRVCIPCCGQSVGNVASVCCSVVHLMQAVSTCVHRQHGVMSTSLHVVEVQGTLPVSPYPTSRAASLSFSRARAGLQLHNPRNGLDLRWQGAG